MRARLTHPARFPTRACDRRYSRGRARVGHSRNSRNSSPAGSRVMRAQLTHPNGLVTRAHDRRHSRRPQSSSSYPAACIFAHSAESSGGSNGAGVASGCALLSRMRERNTRARVRWGIQKPRKTQAWRSSSPRSLGAPRPAGAQLQRSARTGGIYHYRYRYRGKLRLRPKRGYAYCRKSLRRTRQNLGGSPFLV